MSCNSVRSSKPVGFICSAFEVVYPTNYCGCSSLPPPAYCQVSLPIQLVNMYLRPHESTCRSLQLTLDSTFSTNENFTWAQTACYLPFSFISIRLLASLLAAPWRQPQYRSSFHWIHHSLLYVHIRCNLKNFSLKKYFNYILFFLWCARVCKQANVRASERVFACALNGLGLVQQVGA